MINTSTIVGNMTKDAEQYSATDGSAIAKFTVAVNSKGKDGTETADFIPVVAFGHTAVYVVSYAGKGTKVAVNGRLKTRTYEAQDGTKRFVMELVANSVEAMSKAPQNGAQAVTEEKPSWNEIEAVQEELPF